jgi:hypothetical protein
LWTAMAVDNRGCGRPRLWMPKFQKSKSKDELRQNSTKQKNLKTHSAKISNLKCSLRSHLRFEILAPFIFRFFCFLVWLRSSLDFDFWNFGSVPL